MPNSAELECRDTGKPIHQAKVDITACARYFEFYGGAADKLHGETIPYAEGFTVFALREPYGVTGHIIPWNYPAQILGRTVARPSRREMPSVVKPAEDACLSVVRVAELALECGLPPGVFNVVTGLGVEAGAALAAHEGIDHLSFTGSPPVGSSIAQSAAANHIPAVLELGGKSPQIVFRGRRPGPSASGGRQCDRSKCGSDLLGWQPGAHRAADLRSGPPPAGRTI